MHVISEVLSDCLEMTKLAASTVMLSAYYSLITASFCKHVIFDI